MVRPAEDAVDAATRLEMRAVRIVAIEVAKQLATGRIQHEGHLADHRKFAGLRDNGRQRIGADHPLKLFGIVLLKGR